MFPGNFAGFPSGPVPGWIHGIWGIARSAGRYSVLHLPLGCSISDFATTEAVEQFVAAIEDLADWSAPTPAADPAVLQAIQAARRISAGDVPLAAAA
jgi:hypothetical protein